MRSKFKDEHVSTPSSLRQPCIMHSHEGGMEQNQRANIFTALREAQGWYDNNPSDHSPPPRRRTLTPSPQRPNASARSTPTASPSSAKRSKNPTSRPSTRRNISSPADLTVGQFVYVIRKRIKLSPEKAIFIFVDEVLASHGRVDE